VELVDARQIGARQRVETLAAGRDRRRQIAVTALMDRHLIGHP
jgi:hypothetical protein